MKFHDFKDPAVLLRATVADMILGMVDRGSNHIRALLAVDEDACCLITLSIGNTEDLRNLGQTITELIENADKKQTPSRDADAAGVADHSHHETKGGND